MIIRSSGASRRHCACTSSGASERISCSNSLTVGWFSRYVAQAAGSLSTAATTRKCEDFSAAVADPPPKTGQLLWATFSRTSLSQMGRRPILILPCMSAVSQPG